MKLESPSILTKNTFLPGHWGPRPPVPLSTPVDRQTYHATTITTGRILRHAQRCGPVIRAQKRVWRHGRAWKVKIRAWKNQDPCFNFYKQIYALLHKYPFNVIVSDALRIAIKHECNF